MFPLNAQRHSSSSDGARCVPLPIFLVTNIALVECEVHTSPDRYLRSLYISRLTARTYKSRVGQNPKRITFQQTLQPELPFGLCHSNLPPSQPINGVLVQIEKEVPNKLENLPDIQPHEPVPCDLGQHPSPTKGQPVSPRHHLQYQTLVQKSHDNPNFLVTPRMPNPFLLNLPQNRNLG